MRVLKNSWVRWASWFVAALLFAAACFGLANWQLDRRSQAVAKVERMVDNYEKPPIEYAPLSKASLDEITALEWSPVEIVGSYLASEELLVRNRPIAGQPGFLQLVPFELVTGEIVIVERGWIPADSDLSPASTMTPSTDQKTVIARVKLSELTPNRDSPIGFATSIHLSSLKEITAIDLEQNFYLRLMSESPAENQTPQPLGRPLLDEGNHLSYAVQWILFAAMGFLALFWAIRQEREYRRIELDSSYLPRSQRNRKITDGDIEDDLLDSGR